MSDDEFDDFDSFAVDESFLRQVDDIAARAVQTNPPGRSPPPALRPPVYTVLARAAMASPAPNPANPPFRAPTTSTSRAAPLARADPDAGTSRRAAALGVRLPRPPPSDDDFGDMSFTVESLEQIDAAVQAPQRPTSATGSRLPRGRALGRTTSGGFQTHLNFHREFQYTKGKRWDRTAFAASGRRVGAESAKKKGKGKGRAYEDDDDDDEEDLDDEPLAPPPKPLVDISKPYDPQKHDYNPISIRNYIYPTNHPKRDYQYDIIRACFTDNCLVALPTGLGKTFIAGVVMLNFYRWFPTGKIVFLAPTKPLVNQQIEACQLACGIPSADAAVMTGSSVSANQRAKLWDERRVFYCTPQTLDNDLKRGAVDPRDIVLAVFDEAHKASGSYAYTTILAYITAHHPFFRVLALTATPGGDVPKVQGVVDALHISRIEIREAEAPEIKKYMNEKKTEKHVVDAGPVIGELRDRWAAVMRPFIQKLVDKNVLTERDLDAKRLKPYRLTAKRMEIGRDRNSGLMWTMGPLQNIERMARAMGNLLEFSLTMFHSTLLELAGNSTNDGKKGNSRAGANSIRNNIEFQRILSDVEGELNDIGRRRNGKTMVDKHPKMQTTLELLLAHFAQAEEDEKIHGIKNDTRAMVFCSFRECVLDIVDMCNEHPDLLKATKFVGQSQGKQERDKGFNQKEQKKTIQEFKEGKFNILVATSIGEEGLDIGEVDFVVIYDMPKQSIKLLQRIGRTGRKRDGKVHVLMSQGREDLNWDTAQQTHRDIQEEILHSRNLELFEDVEKLLPRGALPECVEKEMDIDPWDPADQKKKRKLASAPEKTKKSTTKKRGYDVPDDAPQGFQSVAELLKKAAKRKRQTSDGEEEDDEEVEERSEDDDEDGDAEDALLYGSVKSARNGAVPKKQVARPKVKKAKAPTKEETAQEKARERDEKQRQERAAAEAQRKENEAAERTRLSRQAIDFFNTQGLVRRRSPTPPSSPPKSSPPSSPVGQAATTVQNGIRLSPRTAAAAGFSQIIDFSFDDDDEDPDEPVIFSSPPRRAPPARTNRALANDMPPPPLPSSPIRRQSAAIAFDTPLGDTPVAVMTPSTGPTPFPVRGGARRRAFPSSDLDDSPAPRPLQRLRRRLPSTEPAEPESPAPPPRPRSRPRDPARRERHRAAANTLMELDAGVSGSDVSSDESSGVEDDSDRRFAGDFQATQAPRGYNQRAVYAAGLSTQGGAGVGLGFANGADRRAAFMAKARRAVLVSDDERSSDNEYELGSFVCDDEDEMAFMSQSDPLGSGL